MTFSYVGSYATKNGTRVLFVELAIALPVEWFNIHQP